MKKRYIVSWEQDTKEFTSYKGAFNFYMKLREGIGFNWLYVFDTKTNKYLICENCFAE